MSTYVVGPMTGKPGFNYPAFHRAVVALWAVGVDATSPAHYENGIEKRPPTPETVLPHADYLRDSLRRLLNASEIVTLPGWRTSPGAKTEVAVAKALNMPIWALEERLTQ